MDNPLYPPVGPDAAESFRSILGGIVSNEHMDAIIAGVRDALSKAYSAINPVGTAQAADLYGRGSSAAGPYLRDEGWNTLTPGEQSAISKNAKSVFGTDVPTRDDVERMLNENGVIETWPGHSSVEQFLRTAPAGTLRYNYDPGDNASPGYHTIFLVKKPPLTS